MKCSEGKGAGDFTLESQGKPHWPSGLSKDLEELRKQVMTYQGQQSREGTARSFLSVNVKYCLFWLADA